MKAAPGSLPWAAVRTAVTVILSRTSAAITEADGGVGSPSLMMTMCRDIASLTFISPLRAICNDGSKSGMSPGVIRSIARSIEPRLLPTGGA